VGAERKKQAAVLKTEGENSYIKTEDKVLPTSQIEKEILWGESAIIRDKQEKQRVYTCTHVRTSDTLQSQTREVSCLVFVQILFCCIS